jgi:hypothetical protein
MDLRRDFREGVLRGTRRRHKAVYAERSTGRLGTPLAQAASDNERVIGCAVRSVLRTLRFVLFGFLPGFRVENG